MVGRWTAGAGLAALAAAMLVAAGCRGPAEVMAEAHQAAATQGNVITVDARGGGDYTSIQAAVEAAPAGATIHVQPGVYHECVEVRKPLVLEGDGPDATTVVAGTLWTGSVQDFVARAQAAQNEGGEAGRAALAGLLQAYARPAVLIQDAEGVTLRGLKLTLLSPEGKGCSMADGVVMVERAKLDVADCILAGAWAYGVKVADGSALRLTDSLVAGVVTSGVEVSGTQDMGAVSVTGTDFRRCGTGVECASGSPLTVEDCRFLRCDLAGLRFEQTAPVVRHCAFVQSHQGIAGWSDEGAAIQGNVFCLSDGFAVNVGSATKARIEQNTFASNAFGVVVLKKPFGSTLEANAFTDNGVAVLLPEEDGAGTAATGQITRNLFWHNSVDIGQLTQDAQTKRQSTLSMPLPMGNGTASPLFRDAPDLDYRPAPGSPLLLQKVGAFDPLPSQSKWPEQPEETRMPRDADTPLGGNGG